ncbi:MAG: pseudouridine synthase [Aquificaceae bacterium]
MEGRALLVRINRYLSMCGVASRRSAEELIKSGLVSINGKTVTDFGLKVHVGVDRVEFRGKEILPQRKVYYILNKPCCYLSSLKDGIDSKKGLSTLIKQIPERVFPVGRLDYNAEGLLILTNDGELALRVMHPRYGLEKVYLVWLNKPLREQDLKRMLKGTNLEDGFFMPDRVRALKQNLIEITIHEGRKHIVKRFVSSFDYKVTRLLRVAIGPIRLGALPPGQFRPLRNSEIIILKNRLYGRMLNA